MIPDYIHAISFFSIILRFFFLLMVFLEILLPRLRHTILKIEWKSNVREEMNTSVMMASLFAFAILLLIALDVLSYGGFLLFLRLLLDSSLIISVVFLLLMPKVYGIAERGIYLNGTVIPWEMIEKTQKRENMLLLKLKGWWREDKRLILPQDTDMGRMVMEEISKRIESIKG